MTNETDEIAYTLKSLAERWTCSPGHVRNLIDRGELPAFRLGKMFRIRAIDVRHFEHGGDPAIPDSPRPIEYYFAGHLRKHKGTAFGVEFPELPGCHAAADDFSSIIAAAQEALRLWFEDRPFSAPPNIGELDGLRTPVGAVTIVVPFHWPVRL